MVRCEHRARASTKQSENVGREPALIIARAVFVAFGAESNRRVEDDVRALGRVENAVVR